MKQIGIWMLTLWLAMAIGLAQAGEYQLGIGDVLSVTVYGHTDLQVDAVQIDERGKVTLPLLGDVVVGGITASAAARKIEYALETGSYIVKPHVNVFVQQYFSKPVAVLGQVNQPGKYALESPSKVSDLLALAGGISPIGSDIVILIHKQDGLLMQTPIDTLSAFKGDHLNLNDEVVGGDIIYVPRAEVFYIYGEVQHPGAYRLEKHMNVMQAIALGGGITLAGTENHAQIRRMDKNGNITMLPAATDMSLMPNDVVYIKQSLF